MPVTKSITVNRPLEVVRSQWQNIEGVNTSDRVVVTFASARAGKETEIRVKLLDEDAAGFVTRLLQKAFGTGVAGDVKRALRQFKQIVEVGEITLSDASIHETKHPAQPTAPHGEATLAVPFVSVTEAVQQ